MRRSWLFPLLLLVASLATPALAQTTTPTADSGFNMSWTALTPVPGDFAAQIIQNVFPVSGSGGVSTTQTTVISQMVGTLTGFVAAIAMAFLCYATVMQIHRGGETGRLLANNMTGLFVVRIGFAAIMMFPIPGNGFSVGQTAVVKMALWGVGMADDVYTTAVKAIGPDALQIAKPMIPGTETIVFGLIQDELCRSLVNVASNTVNAGTQLVPEPTPISMAGAGGSGPIVAMGYSLSVGNIGSAPACGTVTISTPMQGAQNLAGVPVDQSAIQQQALQTALGQISGPVQGIAQSFFLSRQASSLEPLMGVFVSATQAYTQALSSAATNIYQQLNNSVSGNNASGLASQIPAIKANQANQTQLSAMGWAGAGAYYLEFAHLNGATLSVLSATPQVNPPSYAGLGDSLSSDLAPLIQSSQAFLTTLQTTVDTQDGISQPGGYGDLFSGATPGGDGSSAIEQVFRKLHLNDYALQLLETAITPTGNNWTDPFSALMTLGDTLILISVTAMGLAALAASTTGSVAATAFQVLTGNVAGAGATIVLHFLMSFLGTPIFLLLLGMLIPGLTIAFVLPMIPWVMWMAGVMGWLILVCEAVIAVPLWMLAHMTMGGEGLHGNAREGYALIFNVLFRPVLMLFGLFLGYFVFTSMSWLIRETFGVAAGFVLEQGWLVTNILGVIVLISIFVMAHVVAALTSFRMISLVPHHVPRLIGFSSANRVDMDQFSRDAALVGVAGTLGRLDQGLNSGMAAASKPALTGGSPPQLTGPDEGAADGGAPSNRARIGGMDSTLGSTTELGTSSEDEGDG